MAPPGPGAAPTYTAAVFGIAFHHCQKNCDASEGAPCRLASRS